MHRKLAAIKKLYVFLGLFFASILTYGVESKEPQQRYLFLGNSHYPPLIYLEENRPTGLAADLAAAVIEKGQISASINAMTWKQAQENVLTGKADALILFNKTPEREKNYDFSAPFISAEYVFFRKSQRVDVRGPETLTGKRVGVESGGYTTSIMARFPEIFVVAVADLKEGFALLDKGDIDALITERWVGGFELAKTGRQGISSVGEPVDTSTSYIGVRKGNNELLNRVNVGLQHIDSDGTRTEIMNRWAMKEVVYLTKAKINYYQATQVLALLVFALAIALLVYSRKLATARRAVERQNAELERRVAARTRALLIARSDAEQSTATRTQFMANASHHMRTPLQVILGYAAIGSHKATEFSPEEIAGCFDSIHNAGQQMHQLVESMLTIAEEGWRTNHLTSGTYEKSFSTHQLVTECIETMRSAAEVRNQILISDFQAREDRIDGDVVRLRQVLYCLVDNALRYCPDGKTVTLRTLDTSMPGKDVQSSPIAAIAIQVIDDGPGIPVAEMKLIFEPFYEGSHTASGAGGTGLGLPLSEKIVNQHGGTLAASNRIEGGAVFEIRLPCTEPELLKNTPSESTSIDSWDVTAGLHAFQKCRSELMELVMLPRQDAVAQSPACCGFGKWLTGPGQSFSLFQQYHAITELHADLHKVFDSAIHAGKDGSDSVAQGFVEKREKALAAQVMDLLETMRL